jgi:hypothetical protein
MAATGRAVTARAPTSRATTGHVTTGKATTGRATTGRATTGRATTGRATTGRPTAGEATTGRAGKAAARLDAAGRTARVLLAPDRGQATGPALRVGVRVRLEAMTGTRRRGRVVPVVRAALARAARSGTDHAVRVSALAPRRAGRRVEVLRVPGPAETVTIRPVAAATIAPRPGARDRARTATTLTGPTLTGPTLTGTTLAVATPAGATARPGTQAAPVLVRTAARQAVARVRTVPPPGAAPTRAGVRVTTGGRPGTPPVAARRAATMLAAASGRRPIGPQARVPDRIAMAAGEAARAVTAHLPGAIQARAGTEVTHGASGRPTGPAAGIVTTAAGVPGATRDRARTGDRVGRSRGGRTGVAPPATVRSAISAPVTPGRTATRRAARTAASGRQRAAQTLATTGTVLVAPPAGRVTGSRATRPGVGPATGRVARATVGPRGPGGPGSPGARMPGAAATAPRVPRVAGTATRAVTATETTATGGPVTAVAAT